MSEQNENDPNILTNLGSNPAKMAQGEVDMRRFGVYDSIDIPFLVYARLRQGESTFWKNIRDEFMNLSPGVDGKARIQAIHAESVRHGAQPNIEAEMRRPESWIERNITRRNWEKEEKERIGVPPEA